MRSSARVRRSPYLVTYWEDGTHRVYDYATQTTHTGGIRVTSVLDLASGWVTREAVRQGLPHWAPEEVDLTVDDLLACGLLEATDRPPAEAAAALRRWGRWNPGAAFFHRATNALP